jgi:hypothetical protein
MPELATQLVERARSGEDFAQLANEHSSLSEPAGGEMGWRTEEEFMGEHLKPLLPCCPERFPIRSGAHGLFHLQKMKRKEQTRKPSA